MEHYCVVYSLLRTALWGNERYPLCLEENIDWPTVYKELKDHACFLPGIVSRKKQIMTPGEMEKITLPAEKLRDITGPITVHLEVLP